jgi:tetratricopeptide (TPR) repeat protein
LFLAPVAQAINGWTDHDRTDYTWAEDYGRAILDPLPKDSVLLPGGDTSTFPLLYLQGVQGLRRDVLILDRSGVIERDAALDLLPEDLRSDYAEASDGDLRQAIMVYSRRPVVVLRKEPLPPSSGRELVPLGMGFAVAANPTGEQREELRERQRVFLASLTLRNTEIPTVNDHTSDIIRSHVAQVRAVAAFEAGDAEAALNHVREAGRLCQGIKETLNNLGALLAENGHEEEALAYFQRDLSIRGDYLLGRRNYVLTLRRMNRLKDALTEAARGLHLNPEDSLLFEEAAKAALELADGDALSRLCNRRTAIAPDDARPLRYLGLYALHKQGAILLAKSRFEAALAIDPKDRESREALDEINGRFGTNPGNVAASAPDVDPLKALSRHLKSDYVLDAGRNRASTGDRLRESPGSLSPAQMPGGADFGRINAGGGQAHAPVTVPQAPVLGTPVQIRR